MFGRKKRHNLLTARLFFRRSGDKRTSWIMPVVIGVFIVSAAATLVLLPFGLIAASVYQQALSGKDDVLAAEQAVQSLDVETALVKVADAAEKFSSARRQLDKLRPLSFVPYIDERIDVADSLLRTGSAATEAMRQALIAAQDILGVVREVEGLTGTIGGVLPDLATVFQDMTPQQKRQILAGLSSGVPRMKNAVEQVNTALVTFDDMPDNEAARSVQAMILPLRSKLVLLRDTISSILPAAEILPGVLGYPEEKHYLLIFQNDTELRATGGFLSMVGGLTVRDAELISVDLNDVYALDGPSEAVSRPAPPEPIRKYIGVGQWYLRDANWSPDFTVAAEIIERFYEQEYAVAFPGERQPAIDAIIAVTPRLAADILSLTGPITIDGHKFDAENLVDELEFQVEKGFVTAGIPFEQRKAIVGKLFQEMIRRVSSFTLAQMVGFIGDVHGALIEGDLIFLSKDKALQEIILANDWGGKMREVRGDYLAVIDSNLASLKSDPVVHRSVEYSIAPDGGGGFTGRVTVTYDHRGTFTWKTTRYRTYTRLYVPDGSELIGVAGVMENDKLKDPSRRPGKPDIGQEIGRRYFGAFIAIEPGEKRSLEFSFKLAPSVARLIAENAYFLDIDKQAGTSGRGLTLVLDFGKKLTSAEPAEDPKEFGDTKYRYSTDLDIDRHFEVRF